MNQRQLASRCTLSSVTSWENLFAAAYAARRGKSRRPDVEEWWRLRETELNRLREELLAGSYRPGPYRFFEIHEPKRRLIAAAPFRDRVVHHALCRQLNPLLQRRFIARSFSCQIGKGTTAARVCCRNLTHRYRYVLKNDVSKFFPSIDHQILFKKLSRFVRDDHVLQLIWRILESYQTGSQLPLNLFPGDDWTVVASRPRGLPIGNLTSQWWGNFYLDEMDHFLTERCCHGDYLRYTDDFLLFANDPGRLWELRAEIVGQLAALRLRLAEPKSRLLQTLEGVPFCGFRFFPSLSPRILGATKRRFEARRRRLLKRRDFRQLGVSVFAWYQFSQEGNSAGLRQSYARRRKPI